MKTQDILIVHPSNEEQATVIKAFLEALKIRFEFSKDESYNPEYEEYFNNATLFENLGL